MDEQITSAEWGRHVTGELLERWPKTETGEPEPPAFLCHAGSLDMADTMLINRLEAYGIPCVRLHPNNGGFGLLVLGISGTGTDIYVPASLAADARELLKEPDEEMEEENI